ncbi:DUF1972 domain-containing protein [Marinobacterium marinum]|uniref:DUF1972 domain-containing protein n=1 Tax=Marinobacterium marinum TaxID=2756129 RepID=A0A7W2AA58_9GAMM|nr:DUF1972 domain-containing protein [Marinobacterium marinum]MBA4501536.1 DUF1972 domain-containing protein [Marinobacterium marinum]
MRHEGIKHLAILGTRGIPARHGGFETFAEKLSVYLVGRGWQVTVYCQEEGRGAIYESEWQGVRLVHVPVKTAGAAGTILFDWKATRHALSEPGIFLTLGYNTACFNVLQRLVGQTNIINMDGLEWKREKWGVMAKLWLRLNERVACRTANHLVADHPEIKQHLMTCAPERKITMLPYGAEEVTAADAALLEPYGLLPGRFSVVIARPEPENSSLEIVRAFSRKPRQHTLVVLGSFYPDIVPLHREVLDAASDEVLFPGAIYSAPTVQALRFHARLYLHGHKVGGTNPSLVEALGAGCAVIAQDNPFNRWVAGAGAVYFKTEADCVDLFDRLLDNEQQLTDLKTASRARFQQCFTWPHILHDYEQLLLGHYPVSEQE